MDAPSPESRFVRSPTAPTERAGEELGYVLDLGSGRYFRLEGVGLFAWERLDGESDLRAVAREIAAEWEVAFEVALADLLHFAGELVAAGLVLEAGGSAAEADASRTTSGSDAA